MPPTLPNVEHMPTAALLVAVGNISAVYEYTIAMIQEVTNLPNKEKPVLRESSKQCTIEYS